MPHIRGNRKGGAGGHNRNQRSGRGNATTGRGNGNNGRNGPNRYQQKPRTEGRHRHNSTNWLGSGHQHQILENTQHQSGAPGNHSHQSPEAAWIGTTTVNDHNHAVMSYGSTHNNSNSGHEHQIQSSQGHGHVMSGSSGHHRHQAQRLPAPRRFQGNVKVRYQNPMDPFDPWEDPDWHREW